MTCPQYELDPASARVCTVVDADQLRGGDAEANAAIAASVFGGEPGARRATSSPSTPPPGWWWAVGPTTSAAGWSLAGAIDRRRAGRRRVLARLRQVSTRSPRT